MGALCFLIAIILFILAAFGLHFEHVNIVDLGLAFTAAGLLLGVSWPWPRRS